MRRCDPANWRQHMYQCSLCGQLKASKKERAACERAHKRQQQVRLRGYENWVGGDVYAYIRGGVRKAQDRLRDRNLELGGGGYVYIRGRDEKSSR
jgi:hypothetical protein